MSQPYLSFEAEFHDAFWAADDDASEVGLMAEFLAKHAGPALEIGSGSGRLLFPLLARGFDVEGLELSEDMLALCRSALTGATLHHGDMSQWVPTKPYQSILVPAFTFQLAEDPLNTLRHWRGMLRNGGGLYLTVFIPFAELEGDQEENTWYADHQTTLSGGRVARLDTRHRIDPENQILHRDHRYYFADEPEILHESHQTLRWFTHDQMISLFELAGFTIRSAFADFDRRIPVTCSETLEFDGILTYEAIAGNLG